MSYVTLYRRGSQRSRLWRTSYQPLGSITARLPRVISEAEAFSLVQPSGAVAALAGRSKPTVGADDETTSDNAARLGLNHRAFRTSNVTWVPGCFPVVRGKS